MGKFIDDSFSSRKGKGTHKAILRLAYFAGKIKEFVLEKLLLELPEKKTIFRKLKWGIDFCGYIVLPGAILLR